MKKRIAILCLVVYAMTAFIGCSKKTAGTAVNEDKLSIVTTIFPQYDFAREITKDRADVTMLLKPGAESHSYEPSPADIIKIQNSDMFIYVGGENDEWVESILDSMDTSKMKIIKLLDCVNVVEEEHVEGMEAEHEEGEQHENDEKNEEPASNEEHEEEVEYDEHVWTSPKNAILIVEKINEALKGMDEENADFYQTNCDDYVKQLQEVDDAFTDVVSHAASKTIVVGDRFPFRYLADAYGLTYRAAFPGCSTDVEPSAATIAYMINYVKENKIPVVFYIEFSNMKVANTISEETNAKTLMLHSCHNVTKDELEKGVSYVDLMKKNVENLKEALQ